MIKRKVKVPNVVNGGKAHPLGDNLYYITGKSHEQGGVDIGRNPKTGLEVEGGEVMQMGDKDVKVFSRVNFLGGKSPADLVLEGHSPSKVFKAQERFKRINGLNDDGSKKALGGISNIDTDKIKTAASFLPIVGTAMDGYHFIKNPSIENLGWFSASLAADLAGTSFVKGLVKSAKAAKAARAINSVRKAPSVRGYRDISPNFIRGMGATSTELGSSVINGIQLDRENTGKRLANHNTVDKYQFPEVIITNKNRYKMGGKSKVYSITVGGKTRLVHSPSTGGRAKAALGTDKRRGNWLGDIYNSLEEHYAERQNVKPEGRGGYWFTEGFNRKPRLQKVKKQEYHIPVRHSKEVKETKDIKPKKEVKQTKPIRRTIKYNNPRIANGSNRGGIWFMNNRPRAKTSGNKKSNAPTRHDIDLFKKSDLPSFYKTSANDFMNNKGKINKPKNVNLNNTKVEPKVTDVEKSNIPVKKETVVPTNKVTKPVNKTTVPVRRTTTKPKSTPSEIKSKIKYNNPEAFDAVSRLHNIKPIEIGKPNPLVVTGRPQSKVTPVYSPVTNPVGDSKIPLNLNKETPIEDRPQPKITPKAVIPPKGTKFPRLKKFFDDKNNARDAVGLASNIGGSIIGALVNRGMLNRQKAPSAPMYKPAAKLKTRININPQLDKMRETAAAYEDMIDTNTASSNVALARKQRNRFNNALTTNELYGTKENLETELINKDKLNQQAVAGQNVDTYNNWRDRLTTFDNAITEKRSENINNTIGNINTGIQDVIARRDKRDSENMTIRAMASASPNSVEYMHKMGFISDEDYKLLKQG